MSANAFLYADRRPEKVEKYSPADTLVTGNPKQFVEVFHTEPTGKFRSAIWQGEPGAYRLKFPPNKHEFFYLLEGRVKVHSADGSVIEVAAGDACVIPGGFDGIFEIVEYARKHAVVGENL